MITRLIGALVRAIAIAVLVALPSLMLPGIAPDTAQIVVLMALLSSLLTFTEYFSKSPSIIEFRFAGPYNRVRFFTLFVMVLILAVTCRGKTDATTFTQLLTSMSYLIGNATDFPYSPVRNMVLMMPHDAPDVLINTIRSAAGVVYVISLTSMLVFIAMVRIFNWPAKNGAFNVAVNLPLFDPTSGGDVLQRLKRDANVNIILGFLLPFLIPALVRLASGVIDPISLSNPQTLIWTISAWAFLPASMIMRGIALGRVAEMIEEKRRRAYAEAEADGYLTV